MSPTVAVVAVAVVVAGADAVAGAVLRGSTIATVAVVGAVTVAVMLAVTNAVAIAVAVLAELSLVSGDSGYSPAHTATERPDITKHFSKKYFHFLDAAVAGGVLTKNIKYIDSVFQSKMPTITDTSARDVEENEPKAPSLDDFDGFVAAATLFQNPRLARVYVYICYYGPTTIQDLIGALDLARATAYDDVERLEALKIITRDESTRPHRLSAEPFAFVDDDDVTITPTVLHAIATSEIDDDVEYFLNRYGVSRLVSALRVAAAHYAGSLTQRMAADEIDVTPAEGMAIVNALRPVLATGNEHDAFFDRLFPDYADELDFDIDVSSPASDQSPDENLRLL